MKLFLKILFFIFAMIFTVEEVKPSTKSHYIEVNNIKDYIHANFQPTAVNHQPLPSGRLDNDNILFDLLFGSKGLGSMFGGKISTKVAAKGGTQFMKYQENFVLNKNWKNWGNYMSKRGWSGKDIQQTLLKGKWGPYSGTNYLNPGNSMSIVTNPITGKSLIIDNITKEIIQLGGTGFKF